MATRAPVFKAKQDGTNKIISVEGELTYIHMGEFKAVLREHLDDSSCPTGFIFDMKKCKFIDSGSMGMLAEFKKEIDKRGCSMKIENVQSYVEETMKRLRLDTIIDISPVKK